MQLNDVLGMVEDQNRGRWFQLLHPVTGAPIEISVLVAGPDSRVQADAAAQMVDDLAEVAQGDGRVRGADRAQVHRLYLSRCVLDWRVTDGGEPVPFNQGRIMKLLGVAWVKAQIDAFAVNRGVYAFSGEDAEDVAV